MKLPKTVLIWFSLLFIFLAILFFSVSLLVAINSKKNDSYEQTSPNIYQYQEISPNHASYGFVELPQTLSDSDFISYFNPTTDSSIIISKFTFASYECSGQCSCESVRRSANVFTRPVVLLLSSLSSTLAVEIASKSFQDQCLHQLSDVCDERNIDSEVFSCSEHQHESRMEENEVKIVEFSCKGHCLTKHLRSASTIKAREEYFEQNGRWEDLKTTGSVKVERIAMEFKQHYRSKVTGEMRMYPDSYRNQNQRAVDLFWKQNLVPFCKEMSRSTFSYVSPGGQKHSKEVIFCAGSHQKSDRKHISCRLMASDSQKLKQ